MSPCDLITVCYKESVYKTYVHMDVFSRFCNCHQCVKYTQSAIAAHFCRFISVSVGGAKLRRFLKYFVVDNDSLSLSNLSAASRAVTDRVLGRSDLSVARRVSLGFGCLSSRGGSYPSLDDKLRSRLRRLSRLRVT